MIAPDGLTHKVAKLVKKEAIDVACHQLFAATQAGIAEVLILIFWLKRAL
jgi:hypothetical protein